VEEMGESNWKRNERQAARLLGLATAEPDEEHVEVRTLDIELDDETRVTLTITRSGGLSVQTFRDCSRSERPFWRLTGAAVFPPAYLSEWATTLCEAVGAEEEHAR
jgi:hypothetical protein